MLNSERENSYITLVERHTKLYRLPLRLNLFIKSVPDHVLRCNEPFPIFAETQGHHWKIPKERWLLCRKLFTDRCGHALFAAALRFIELVRRESSNGIYCESYACAHTGALRATGVFTQVWPPVERISANSLPASRSKRPLSQEIPRPFSGAERYCPNGLITSQCKRKIFASKSSTHPNRVPAISEIAVQRLARGNALRVAETSFRAFNWESGVDDGPLLA